MTGLDAARGVELVGTVKTVSNLADSNRGWMNGGVKEYSTIVTIDNTPTDSSLKPGMTAEVVVQVDELVDVLQVPVQAIAENKGTFYAFVEGPKGFGPKPVKVGETDEKFVEVTEGLREGDVVALDARKRGVAYFKEEDDKPKDAAPKAPPPDGGPPPGGGEGP